MNKYFEATNRLLSHIDTIHWVEEINIGDKDLYEQDKKTIWELVEKATPKKVIVNGIREGRTINTVSYTCPSCENHIGRDSFCKYCGQALDWEIEVQEDEKLHW